ncbi:MAG TPA: VOC family protein [Edaphobacter sp.]|jgi:methylmalonyl-CoA/ethylmalonyl-CoA epimerase|nr:VOC family protein [Edaphobacter sp.]
MTSNSSSELKLERLVQIGIVVPDLDKTTRLLGSLFGIGPFRSVMWPNSPESKYEHRGVEEHILISQAFVQLGQVEIELIQPVEGERNAYKQFLDETGGGIHHILFEVKDIDPVLQALAESGMTVLQSGTGIRPGTRWALLDTQEQLGFLVELRHRPGESDGASIS